MEPTYVESWRFHVSHGLAGLTFPASLPDFTYMLYSWKPREFNGYVFAFQPVEFNLVIQPACLPGPYAAPAAKETCAATGCGSTAVFSGIGIQNRSLSSFLQQVDLDIVENSVCADSFPLISPEMICAGKSGKDT